jgi:hypothetical protein
MNEYFEDVKRHKLNPVYDDSMSPVLNRF